MSQQIEQNIQSFLRLSHNDPPKLPNSEDTITVNEDLDTANLEVLSDTSVNIDDFNATLNRSMNSKVSRAEPNPSNSQYVGNRKGKP